MNTAQSSLPLARANVGIITALPEEYAAVCAVLSRRSEVDVPGKGAGRKYSVGEVKTKTGGVHFVAVALLTDMGNNSAAVRATQMAHHCPSVDYFIMVGIAGAVPNPQKAEDHVRLGDVVVTDRNGVVQYDFDKEEPKVTKHRHPPRPPGAALLEAVRSLAAGEALKKRPWDSTITKAISKLGKDWKRPPNSCDTIQDTGTKLKVTAHPKDPKRIKGLPRVFHGPVGSANKLLKDPKKRNALRDRFAVKAVEMEGSGLADSAWNSDSEYLVVRGTCDYCNPAKGDRWHKYAALIAAAYARSVIEALAPGPSKPAGARNPTRRAGAKTLSRNSAERQRDLKQLERLFYWVNLNMLDHFIDRMLNYGRLGFIGLDFCDAFGEALNSSGFHLYDKRLKELIIAFYKAWRRCSKHSDSMERSTNGKEAFFPMPGDYFVSRQQEADYKFTVAQARPLRDALDALLDYVRGLYIELDLAQSGVKAVKYYLS